MFNKGKMLTEMFRSINILFIYLFFVTRRE